MSDTFDATQLFDLAFKSPSPYAMEIAECAAELGGMLSGDILRGVGWKMAIADVIARLTAILDYSYKDAHVHDHIRDVG